MDRERSDGQLSALGHGVRGSGHGWPEPLNKVRPIGRLFWNRTKTQPRPVTILGPAWRGDGSPLLIASHLTAGFISSLLIRFCRAKARPSIGSLSPRDPPRLLSAKSADARGKAMAMPAPSVPGTDDLPGLISLCQSPQ